MGKIIGVLFVLLLLMCLCIYNWWELREKSKRMFEDEKKRINPFNSYAAWGLYALIILLGILGVAGYEIYKLMLKIYTM
ncbi:MAG TPA: hypothetical protein VHP38_06195 [Ruminiclostridium sp.]|nr:hypothetical protein [Ruminiclostridium sp.]